jgi:hypothetical protein
MTDFFTSLCSAVPLGFDATVSTRGGAQRPIEQTDEQVRDQLPAWVEGIQKQLSDIQRDLKKLSDKQRNDEEEGDVLPLLAASGAEGTPSRPVLRICTYRFPEELTRCPPADVSKNNAYENMSSMITTGFGNLQCTGFFRWAVWWSLA